jgi:hypothetical protein
MVVNRADVNVSEVSGSTIVQAFHSTPFSAPHRTPAGSDFIVIMNVTAFLPTLVVVLACVAAGVAAVPAL